MAKHVAVRIDLDTIGVHSTKAICRERGLWVQVKLRRDKNGTLFWRYPVVGGEYFSAHGAWIGSPSNRGLSGWRKVPVKDLKSAFYISKEVERQRPITEEMYF